MSAAGPTVSVIVCTLNRADFLGQALAGLSRQTLAAERFEVVVVDNGSSDHTAAVVAGFAASHPNIRYVSEPRLGLSHARNRGAGEAAGDLLAFLDDDATPVEEWLEWLVDAFADPAVAAVGGRVLLAWPPGGRPAWLPEGREIYYTRFDLGDERTKMAYPVYPFGANMAIRRQAFVAVGAFSDRLGRKGRSLMSGEEKDLFRRLSRHSAIVVYEPRATVHHHVLADRATPKWLVRRVFDQGRSTVLFDHLDADRPRRYWLRRTLRGLAMIVLNLQRTLAALVLSRDRARDVILHGTATAYWLGATGQSVRCLVEAGTPEAAAGPA